MMTLVLNEHTGFEARAGHLSHAAPALLRMLGDGEPCTSAMCGVVDLLA